ncbi:MAG: hypothetical protein H6626_14070 [Pseudobdellovibrionaceae bacterium]|nr:hypothetical protein [Bdellovibrionales bacterium]USN47297.1 MAG: hypothetical protein H6626_14070 [Pseudobdellovibrionaceae bacterium]
MFKHAAAVIMVALFAGTFSLVGCGDSGGSGGGSNNNNGGTTVTNNYNSQFIGYNVKLTLGGKSFEITNFAAYENLLEDYGQFCTNDDGVWEFLTGQISCSEFANELNVYVGLSETSIADAGTHGVVQLEAKSVRYPQYYYGPVQPIVDVRGLQPIQGTFYKTVSEAGCSEESCFAMQVNALQWGKAYNDKFTIIIEGAPDVAGDHRAILRYNNTEFARGILTR